MNLFEGITINNYKLLKFKGKGTTAEVWSVEDIQSHKKYALKIFAPDVALDQQSKKLLKEEYLRTRELTHEYIINPLEHFEIEGRPVLLFKLCDHSLWEELKSRMATRLESGLSETTDLFSEDEIAALLNNISDALDYLHRQKMIHHDIKPANILVKRNDEGIGYFLSDFGITKEVRETIIRQTKTRSSSLTLAYAAPERLRGDMNDRIESDIFSLGASIYELTNSITIPPGEILNNNGVLEPIKGHYSLELRELINRCLSKDYNKRLTAKEIFDYTQNYLTSGQWPDALKVPENHQTQVYFGNDEDGGNTRVLSGIQGTPPSGPIDYSPTVKKRSPILYIALLAVLGLLLFLGYKWFYGDSMGNIKSKIIAKNGYQIVQLNNNKCGILDEKNKWVLPPKYDKCIYYLDSVVFKTRNTKQVFIIK